MSDSQLISLQPGTIIAGRYEVVKCLGEGSMGLVYACRHRELSGHLVGVKVLYPEVAQDKIAAARFKNEVFASYGVSHPNVVRAYEFIKDGDLVAYTMEYVAGGDLADRLARKSDLIPIPETIKMLSQMCAGVQAIHDVGIVHRDLKPENILLTKDGNIKITDFGIARTGYGPKLTEHGGVVGTIDYVSPEYMLNSQVDWRSDIYALGILAYEMIAGESPFSGDSVYAVMTQRLKTDPKPPSLIRAESPKRLDEIVLKAMQRDPDQRYQSAAQMYYDLQIVGKEQSLSIGSSIQISESASKTYIGPSLKDDSFKEDTEEPVSSSSQVDDSLTTDKTTVISDVSSFLNPQVIDSSPPVAPKPKIEQSPSKQMNQVTTSGSEDDDLGTTEVKSRGIADLAERYRAQSDGFDEPEKMESILSKHGDQLAEAPTVVSIQSLALNDSRVRNLSKKVKHKGLLTEVFIILFAIVLGVSVGFLLISKVFPDLVNSKSVEVEEVGVETLVTSVGKHTPSN
ncbi:MAG: serine/threonine protein kinase [Bdellovibrionales bacterium]|nr:serine/threonine protein kinase [Bdellovibrionales bacterium]